MDDNTLSGVTKIAVLRATALGDFILAVPALRALHETYPQAEIVYLGRQWHSNYLPGRLPGISRVVHIPTPHEDDIRKGFIINLDFYKDFICQMRSEHFDLAVQMHGAGVKSNPFIQDFNARISIGTKAPEAAALDRWIPYVHYQHETLRCLEIVSLVGAQTAHNLLAPQMPILNSDLIAASAAIVQLRRPFVVIHASSTDPRRTWPSSHFAAVADYCAEILGMDVVLTGTLIDEVQVMDVMRQMRTQPVNMLNQLSLQGLTGLLSKAALVISNDSGPMHLAYSVGAKTIGLFVDESIVNFLPLNRSYFYPLIAWGRHCPACGMYCDKAELDEPTGPCQHFVSFLNKIPVKAVLQTIHQVMD